VSVEVAAAAIHGMHKVIRPGRRCLIWKSVVQVRLCAILIQIPAVPLNIVSPNSVGIKKVIHIIDENI
jgi:hypothetical protein